MGKADVIIQEPDDCLAKFKELKTHAEDALQSADVFLSSVADLENIGNNMNAAKEALKSIRGSLNESVLGLQAQEGTLTRMCRSIQDIQGIKAF